MDENVTGLDAADSYTASDRELLDSYHDGLYDYHGGLYQLFDWIGELVVDPHFYPTSIIQVQQNGEVHIRHRIQAAVPNDDGRWHPFGVVEE